jgi:hypothetical protein
MEKTGGSGRVIEAMVISELSSGHVCLSRGGQQLL